MTSTNELSHLQKVLEFEYLLHRQGIVSEKEYLDRVRPIDKAIGELEMTTLQGTPVLQVTSLQHSLMREH